MTVIGHHWHPLCDANSIPTYGTNAPTHIDWSSRSLNNYATQETELTWPHPIALKVAGY